MDSIDTSVPTLAPPAQAYQKGLEPGATVAPPTPTASITQPSDANVGVEQSGPSLLVQKWRAKYGDSYKDMDDDTLQRKIVTAYPGSYDDLAGAHSSQEMDLQNRIHTTTATIAGLRTKNMDYSPSERDLVNTQKLLGQLQGVDTETPGWTSKLRIGAPTPGTTGGLETTGQQAASLIPETGAALYRMGKTVISTALKSSLVGEAYDAYHAAVTAGQSPEAAADAADAVKTQRTAKLTQLKGTIDDYLKHPDREAGELLANTIVAAATEGVVHAGDVANFGRDFMSGGVEPEETEANEAIARAKAQVTHVYNAETGEIELKDPSLFQKAMQGEQAAQPAVRHAIGENLSPNVIDPEINKAITDYYKMGGKPLLKGNATMLDAHIEGLQKVEEAAYSKIDKAAGFDVKAEKQALANDQYKLKQLGNTDADVTQRGNLIDSINDSETRIADAETKLKAAGLSSDYPDFVHKTKMAAGDIKKALINNVSSDGQTVNINGFLNAAKKLRFAKYGDRIAQFVGSEARADKFMSDIEQAQKLGKSAQSVQNISKILGKYVIPGASILGAGYAGYEAVTK